MLRLAPSGLRRKAPGWAKVMLAVRSPTVRERPRLAQLHENIRRRKRFSKQSLARASGVSATYIAQIEAGFDPRTGKTTEPSPKVLRLLANALSTDAMGDSDEVEAERIYDQFMTAAGYIEAVREEAASYEVEPTIDLIVRNIERTRELSPEDKEAFIRLIRRSRRILRGEPDEEE